MKKWEILAQIRKEIENYWPLGETQTNKELNAELGKVITVAAGLLPTSFICDDAFTAWSLARKLFEE